MMPIQTQRDVESSVQRLTPDGPDSALGHRSISWCDGRSGRGENKKTKGNISYENGQYLEAEHVYLTAIEQAEQIESLNPRFADALNELAVPYAKQHKYARGAEVPTCLGSDGRSSGPEISEKKFGLHILRWRRVEYWSRFYAGRIENPRHITQSHRLGI